MEQGGGPFIQWYAGGHGIVVEFGRDLYRNQWLFPEEWGESENGESSANKSIDDWNGCTVVRYQADAFESSVCEDAIWTDES